MSNGVYPSSAVWTQDGKWYGQVTIYIDAESDHPRQVEIEREFTLESVAMDWRDLMISLLKHSTTVIRGDREGKS